MSKKKILDSCCGSRMCWFDKCREDVVYMDNRSVEETLCDGRKLIIRPDIVADFRDIPYPNDTFYLVLYDPPHLLRAGDKSWLSKKYGRLNKDNWKSDIKRGFDECMRVLRPNGTLVFKWNENQIKLKEIIQVIDTTPLFGHTSGRNKETVWMIFIKNEPVHE